MKKFNFYKPQYHIQTGFSLALVFVLCYLVPNQIDWLPTTPVSLVFVDQFIRLRPEWIWFYLITYPYVVLIYFLILKGKNAKTFVNSFVLASLVGSMVFLFYPTIIIRDLYTINPDDNLSSWMLHYFRMIDKPKNCIPSFHIALTFITCACLYMQDKTKGFVGIILGFLIAYSTMAVKQHYFLDVVSGLLLGIFAFSTVLISDK